MKTSHLVIAIAFLGILLMAGRPLIDSDTWWHLRAGQWIVDNGSLPDVDRFSFTREGHPWHYPGWLAEILMYGVYAISGLSGLNLAFLALIVASMVVVFFTMQGDPFLRAFALVLAAAASSIYWSARPQLFTFFFSALYFLCLREFHHGKRNVLAILPLAMVLWVNMHGGFAAGLGIILFFLLGQTLLFVQSSGEVRKKSKKKTIWLAGVLAVCLVAVLANPYGVEMLVYPFKTVSIQALRIYIQEWQSPDFHSLHAQMYLVLLFFTWVLIAYSPQKTHSVDAVLLLAAAYAGFVSWRNTVFLAIVAPSLISSHGSAILKRHYPQWKPAAGTSAGVRIVHVALALVVCFGAFAQIYVSIQETSIQQDLKGKMPVEAAAYLDRHPGLGNLLNSYNWGSYLMWRLPSYPVFVDGRTDVFDDEILGQYTTAVNAQEGWREILNRWQIDLVLLEPSAPLLELLRGEGWQTIYRDSLAVVLLNPTPEIPATHISGVD